MLQHFKVQPMFAGGQLPGWTFSFYISSARCTGDYMPDGTIRWTSAPPADEEEVKRMIHELMTFHVYE
ncbi:hypothetical protein NCCP2716_23830 [Sporosarcina sp. NCCP-2716]|uniref:YheE family protein n=1 Tax=Sporosarcina sp. NCCP-2716 TaxID=2943679 RepID=UPI002040097C|nr:YheE family protein [Sporosarcina sp. NCCP-2716]GKV69885.1 hypothetical protein NCCP2716_23830 [Sporosarcina sp. NCCP-2716]